MKQKSLINTPKTNNLAEAIPCIFLYCHIAGSIFTSVSERLLLQIVVRLDALLEGHYVRKWAKCMQISFCYAAAASSEALFYLIFFLSIRGTSYPALKLATFFKDAPGLLLLLSRANLVCYSIIIASQQYSCLTSMWPYKPSTKSFQHSNSAPWWKYD